MDHCKSFFAHRFFCFGSPVEEISILEINEICKGRDGMNSRIDELKDQIGELKRNWPKHSVPPGLIQQLDDLEEELEQELKKTSTQQNNPAANPES